jgi:hypothetical protein
MTVLLRDAGRVSSAVGSFSGSHLSGLLGLSALLATALVVPSSAGAIPVVASTVAANLQLTTGQGLWTLRWQQNVRVSTSMLLGPNNVLASGPATALPRGAAPMPDHGRISIGLSSAKNPVFTSEASVRGSRLFPGVWLRKDSTGLTSQVGGEPSAAAVLTAGDTYQTAATEFSWPGVTAPMKGAGSARGKPVLAVGQAVSQVVGFHTAAGDSTARVTTTSGYLRAAGGSIDGGKHPVSTSVQTLPLPNVDVTRTTIVLVVMTMPLGSDVDPSGIGFVAAPRPHLTVRATIRGTLEASANLGSRQAPAYTNVASFFVAVIHSGLGDWWLPSSLASATVDAPPGSTVLLTDGHRARHFLIGRGAVQVAAALDGSPAAATGAVGSCRFTVERADDPARVSASPAPVRGHASLGVVTQGGRQLRDLGKLTVGEAVVDGVSHDLTPRTADFETVSPLPPWALPSGSGPLSPYLSDAISDFAAGCKVSDGRVQEDSAHDGYGGAGGTQLRAVWDLGSVVVEGSLLATSNARVLGPASTWVIGQMTATSRDGAPHLVGLSLGLLGVSGSLEFSLPQNDQPSAPVKTAVTLPEAQQGFVPLRIDSVGGHFDVMASGQAAPPDYFPLAGRYAGPAVTSVTNSSGSMNPMVVPGVPLNGPADVFFETGADTGAGLPSYYGSLLVALQHSTP